MVANYRKCSRLKEKFIMKFVVAEKCKLCETYRRMCDVNGEACFCQKMFRNEFSTMSLNQKDRP